MVASFDKFKQNSSRTYVAPGHHLDFERLARYLRFLFPKSFMSRANSRRFLTLAALAALALAGCAEEDPRLAYGETQYLGGIYGNEPVSSSAPVDTISYWDGEGMLGKPAIRIPCPASTHI